MQKLVRNVVTVRLFMSSQINSEIISIGTEILLGEITDTNSVYLAKALRDVGINVFYMTSVGDNRQRIADSIRTAMKRSNLVITCGGLGPTVDDMTRQAVADATDRELVFHPPLFEQIADRFKSFRATMTENNRQQAFLPANAITIENPVGTAPSFAVGHQGSIVISLPGVPREMKFLMTEKVIPMLKEKFDLGIIKARVLHTAGIGESTLDDVIGRGLLEASNPTVGLAAHNGQVDVRITAKADSETEADSMIAEYEAELRQRIGKYVFGADAETLEDVLRLVLSEHGASVAVADAGLNGSLVATLGAAVITSALYDSPDSLRTELQMPEASLRQLTEAAAADLHEKTGATICIAVASRPDVEESADSAESTSVTVKLGEKIRSRVYGFGAKSELVRSWIKTWSLAQSWWMLKEAMNE
ncbi:MAG: CinA family nicotinamide mononucleotide deamidase-related protein [Anaerolineae bacterium]|nr:CinA family nicotinamide mononucleotide deamidase-related protein [Anaerolineae bacterium]